MSDRSPAAAPPEAGALAAVPEQAQDVWAPVLSMLRGAYSDATLKGYGSALRVFHRWCDHAGRCALPATPETLAGFIDAFAERSAPDSMTQKISAIRLAYRILKAPDPTRAMPVKLARRRLRRLSSGARRPVIGVTRPIRDRLLAACGEDLLGLRDRALVGLGFDTLCRGSELGALRIEDIEPQPDGTARILVRQSKTDRAARGAWAYISPPTLRDVMAWRDAAGLTSGPVLRRMSSRMVGAGQVSAEAITARVRRLAWAAGFTDAAIAQLSSRSFRVGAVHELAAAGRPLLDIMRAGRWRSLDAVAVYLRGLVINPWGDDAAPFEAAAFAQSSSPGMASGERIRAKRQVRSRRTAKLCAAAREGAAEDAPLNPGSARPASQGSPAADGADGEALRHPRRQD